MPLNNASVLPTTPVCSPRALVIRHCASFPHRNSTRGRFFSTAVLRRSLCYTVCFPQLLLSRRFDCRQTTCNDGTKWMFPLKPLPLPPPPPMLVNAKEAATPRAAVRYQPIRIIPSLALVRSKVCCRICCRRCWHRSWTVDGQNGTTILPMIAPVIVCSAVAVSLLTVRSN